MKSLRTILLLSLAVIVLAAPLAQAQTIGVYFGPDKATSTRVVPFSEFKIWVILSEIENTVNAVEYKLNLPAGLVVVDQGLYEGSVDIGNPTDGVAMGLGDCVAVYTAPGLENTLVVQEMTAIAVEQFGDTAITITEFTGGEAPASAPRYNTCDAVLTTLTPQNGTLAASVALDQTSWGAVKSLYE